MPSSTKKALLGDPPYKKELSAIKNAGQWSRVLGWILLVISPITIMLGLDAYGNLQDLGYATILLYILIAAPVSIYLLIGGKYIQTGGGRGTKPILIINLILSISLARGLIPLIVFFVTLSALLSYRKLKKADQLSRLNKGKASISLPEIIVFTGILLLGSAIIMYSVSHLDSNGTKEPSTTTNSFVSYTSVKHKFKASFPGSPSTESEAFQSYGYNISYSTYEVTKANDAFLISVYDYQSIDKEIDQEQLLEGELNGMAQTDKGGAIISSQYSSFGKYKALDAELRIPNDSNMYNAHVKIIAKGKLHYVILVLTDQKSNFDTFVNSFSFTE